MSPHLRRSILGSLPFWLIWMVAVVGFWKWKGASVTTLVVFEALGVLGFVWNSVLTARRLETAQQSADSLGFNFLGDVAYDEVAPFELLGMHGKPLLYNVMRSEHQGGTVAVARHRLMFHRAGSFGGSGLSCALAAFEVPGLDLPHFAVHPRRIGGCRLHDLDLGEEFGVPTHPGFREALMVTAEDQSAMRLFSPEVITFFARDPQWFVEGEGNRFLVFRLTLDRQPLQAEQIPLFLQAADRVLGLFRSPA